VLTVAGPTSTRVRASGHNSCLPRSA
jgi:hypothetical protein